MPPDDQTQLHRMDPLARFTNRAEEYVKYRPSYPEEALSAILDGLGEPAQLVVADVGAGTGISSRLLAGRGCRVSAIEPNQAMIDVAEPHPLVEFKQGQAEDTGLAEDSVHAVTCFQSFHWFEPAGALREFHRILKPGGRLALVWNDRDLDDPVSSAYTAIIQEASGNHPAEGARLSSDNLGETPYFPEARKAVFKNHQDLDLDGLIGRARSSSYVPREGPEHDAMVDALGKLYAEMRRPHGAIRMGYLTNVYLTEAKQG
ncbi:MAG: class I SAM-dependent methyltransferase [Dehalococcoidia bacterium]